MFDKNIHFLYASVLFLELPKARCSLKRVSHGGHNGISARRFCDRSHRRFPIRFRS